MKLLPTCIEHSSYYFGKVYPCSTGLTYHSKQGKSPEMNYYLHKNCNVLATILIKNPLPVRVRGKKLYFLTIILLYGVFSFAQNHTVTGKVTDASNGAPLAGVNITVKGALQGAITGTDGEYSISISDPISTLEFSIIGYTSQEVKVNRQSTIDIQLSIYNYQSTDCHWDK